MEMTEVVVKCIVCLLYLLVYTIKVQLCRIFVLALFYVFSYYVEYISDSNAHSN